MLFAILFIQENIGYISNLDILDIEKYIDIENRDIMVILENRI